MRLKSLDGPLSIHNGNSNEILNSPKRINTIQNTNNVTSNYGISTTAKAENVNNDTLNNINSAKDKVQWCNVATQQQEQAKKRELTINNVNNRNQLLNINNTLAASLRTARHGTASSIYSESSPDDSLLEFEVVPQNISSADTSPQDEECPFDLSDSEEESNLSNTIQRRGIVNPNYPGFQHLAHTLDYGIKGTSDTDLTDDDYDYESLNTAKSQNDVNSINNNNVEDTDDFQIDHIDSVNRLDSVENIQKVFYDKPVFDIPTEKCENPSPCDSESSTTSEEEIHVADIVGDFEKEVEQEFGRISLDNLQENENAIVKEAELASSRFDSKSDMPLVLHVLHEDVLTSKVCDAFLSSGQEKVPDVEMTCKDSNRELEEIECRIEQIKSEVAIDEFNKEELTKNSIEKDDDSAAVPRKKEKIDYYMKKRRDYNQQSGSLITFPRREFGRSRDPLSRRSRDKKMRTCSTEAFDVYNIETAMPKIDLEAIESHLRAAREEERRRRTDREEIRRRLAMGSEDDHYTDRPGRKPSLQARLQSGMNLQICFMNETVSDTESPSSDSECTMTNPKQSKNSKNSYEVKMAELPTRPATLSIGQPPLQPITQPISETDFFTRQARLQTEARMALAQAKEMARMQMEIERQKQKKSPITEMVRHSLEKVGIPFPEEKRRLSRQILTEMNVAQLQVIVNDLHTQIETLNENLVKFLMDRDDLHMEQDSMLVDIEDLTRYLGAKEQVLKELNNSEPIQNNNIPPPSPAPSSPLAVLNSSVKPHLHRIANLVKK